MKTQEHPNEVLERSRYEADLGVSINALFLCCPRLHGFAVRGAPPLCPSGFAVTDISIYPACDLDTAVAHLNKIEAALAKLIDECPEARELLCGRTFARVLH